MDAFNEIPEFKRFVGYYRLVQTPPDRLMGGCALTPALSGEPDRSQARSLYSYSGLTRSTEAAFPHRFLTPHSS